MIMKRIIYAALAAMMMLSGCEYHPFYDGQKFRVSHKDYGLLESDGAHIYVPHQLDEPFVLSLYGGWGKSHHIEIEDQECLGYSYEKGDVKKSGFDGPDMIAAGVTLIPKKIGDTVIRITEETTGESISIFVHVCEAYKAIKVYETQNSLAVGTLLAFRYGGVDDVVKICREDSETGAIEHIVDGRYAFVDHGATVHLEMTFPADEAGQPCAGGAEISKEYDIEFKYGGTYGTANGMMERLNLLDFPLATKSSSHYNFQFVDITGGIVPDTSLPDTRIFYVRSAEIIPWI